MICCEDEKLTQPLPTIDEDYWEPIINSGDIVRDIKMCSNGYMFAESPGNIMLSVDSGKSWKAKLFYNSDGSLAVGPNDEVYVAGYSEMFFSYDYGETWYNREIRFFNTDSTTVGVFITDVATSTNGRVYIGTSGGVFRSDDRGNSWQRLVNGMGLPEIRSILVSINGDIFAGTNSSLNGIYVSTDEGENWTDINTVEMDRQIILCLVEDHLGNLYAGGTNRLLFSSDHGKQWQIIANANAYFEEILIDLNNTIYVTFPDGGMFLSNDLGNSWEEKSSGLEKLVGIRSLFLDDNGYLFAGTDGIGIYKSKKSVYE